APSVLASAEKLAADSDPRVRFQLALSIGDADPKRSIEALSQLAPLAAKDPLLRSAILTSVADNAAELALRLLHTKTKSAQQGEALELVPDLARIAAASPNAEGARLLFKGIVNPDVPAGLKLDAIRALGKGLGTRGQTIASLLADDRDSETR